MLKKKTKKKKRCTSQRHVVRAVKFYNENKNHSLSLENHTPFWRHIATEPMRRRYMSNSGVGLLDGSIFNYQVCFSPFQTEVDGEFKSMPPGFPKLMEQGVVQRFIFRGPRFNRTIVFDPVVELEVDDDEGDGDGDGDGDKDRASSIHLNALLFVAVLVAIFM